MTFVLPEAQVFIASSSEQAEQIQAEMFRLVRLVDSRAERDRRREDQDKSRTPNYTNKLHSRDQAEPEQVREG